MLIYHLADVHIGASPLRLKARIDFERLQFDLLKDIFESAVKDNTLAVIISGDLFDTNEVPDRLVEKTLRMMRESPLRFVILPGAGTPETPGHDSYFYEFSVYKRPIFSTLPPNITLLTPESPRIRIDKIGFYGGFAKTKEDSPLPRAQLYEDAEFHIAVVHGSLREDFEFFIPLEELKYKGYDYVALGHIHRFYEYDLGDGRKAAYPGTPLPLGFPKRDGESEGSYARVELEKGNVRVEKRKTGGLVFLRKTIESPEEMDRLMQRVDKQTLLHITCPESLAEKIEALKERSLYTEPCILPLREVPPILQDTLKRVKERKQREEPLKAEMWEEVYNMAVEYLSHSKGMKSLDVDEYMRSLNAD